MDEYEFILNNLDCLEQGGKCVAIIPMQSALAQTGKVFEYKKKVLEQHTLEAVFSMPDELFFNSKVGVVSCIMVFTAKDLIQKIKKFTSVIIRMMVSLKEDKRKSRFISKI